jgi:hypothetical protein
MGRREEKEEGFERQKDDGGRRKKGMKDEGRKKDEGRRRKDEKRDEGGRRKDERRDEGRRIKDKPYFIPHPSSFILYLSSLILHPLPLSFLRFTPFTIVTKIAIS